MDMVSSNSSNTAAASALHHNHQQEMVAPPLVPKEEGRNGKAKQQIWVQQAAAAANGEGERKPRPQHDEALKCPRCDSSNTKFCYYNNYSMTQPRYLCKSCRRYWTQGGTLRNIPVGGGSRKNKRNSALSSSSDAAAPSSNTTSSTTEIINSSTHQLMMMMPTPMTMVDLSSMMLPTFMSAATGGGGFEEHQVSLPFAPLSIPSNEAPADGSGATASFLDMLRGGFPDGSSGSNGHGMVTPFLLPPFDAMPPMHATQLVGPLQGQGVSNATIGGLQHWMLSQQGSINGGGFAAGSSSARVQQQQQQQEVGDHGAHHQESKVLMGYWAINNDANRGSVASTSGSNAASTNPQWP